MLQDLCRPSRFSTHILSCDVARNCHHLEYYKSTDKSLTNISSNTSTNTRQDHVQVVEVEGVFSSDTLTRNSLLQGTVLEPLHFVVTPPDMLRASKTIKLTSYSDDTNVTRPIKDHLT